MNISSEEAQASLDVIRQTQARLRKAIASGYASSLLILWGLIWIGGFSALHVSHRIGGYVFTGLDIIGVLATLWIACRWPHQTVIKTPESRTLNRQLAGFGMSLAVYALIWALLCKPANAMATGAFICTICMFGYVVIGLWFGSAFMMWLGLGVTAVTLVGFYGLADYFYLWMALSGGGALLATGLYIRRWR